MWGVGREFRSGDRNGYVNYKSNAKNYRGNKGNFGNEHRRQDKYRQSFSNSSDRCGSQKKKILPVLI